MPSPTLSIVTPSYNQSEYLEKNLQSVCSQSGIDVEHIVVDGGSNDDTLEILRKYESEYNLRWVSEDDRGQTHALNKGVDMAEGDWIGWQNSDDYYLPRAFERLSEIIEHNPDLDGVYGDLSIVDREGKEFSRQFMTQPSKFVQRYWSLFASNQSLFVNQSVFNEITPLDEGLKFTMDAELTWALLNGDFNLFHVPEQLGAFRVQSEAKTFGEIDEKQQSELDSIYDHPIYEEFFPREFLETLAKLIKLGLLIQNRRFDGIWYNIKKAV